MKVSIQLFILSRDRPIMLKQALESMLHQEKASAEVEIIVSDNSITDDVTTLISRDYPTNQGFKYIKRDPPLSAKDHYAAVISEASEDYTVIFHDDDLMQENYIKTISSFIGSNKDVVLVGGNGIQFVDGACDDQGQRIVFTDKVLFFSTKKDFLLQYLVGSKGVPPFPGYIYKTSALKKLDVFSLSGGKYADVVLLSEMLNFGKAVYLPNILMSYRIHSNNDSGYENIADRISLLNYISRQGIDKNNPRAALFRVRFWSKWILKQKKFHVFGWREYIVCKFIVNSLLRSVISRVLWVAIYNKSARLWQKKKGVISNCRYEKKC